MLKLDGRAYAGELRESLKGRVENFQSTTGITPCLAVVLVGDDPASQVYVSHKIKACKKAGIQSIEKRLAADTKEEELISVVEALNNDPSVHGILVQLPLPENINEERVIDSISALKDADGLSVENLGLLLSGRKRVAPCTPSGVIELLKRNEIEISGKRAVVVGRSQIVGKPMALLLLQENATVTICHSRTKDMRAHLKEADLVVVAAGRPEFLGRDDFKKGSVVVDVGIHRKENGKLCGDVRADEVTDIVSALSPVPGGVGPMTIAMLLENTLKLAKLHGEKNQ